MVEQKETVGARLLRLKERSLLSLDMIADRGGYSGRSSVQRIFNAKYNPPYLTPGVISKLTQALAGQGTPPIEASEIVDLGGYVEAKAQAIEELTSDQQIPVVKMVRSKPMYLDLKGQLVETCYLKARKMAYEKPSALNGRSVIAIQIDAGMMSPRYMFGDTILIDYSGSAADSNDVLVELNVSANETSLMVFGRTLEISDTAIRLYQYDPKLFYEISQDDVTDIFPVIPLSRVLSPHSTK
jgi:hypothetical protein